MTTAGRDNVAAGVAPGAGIGAGPSSGPSSVLGAGPAPDCSLCPRLAAFRTQNRCAFPDFFNRPVPSFGPLTARLLIVGLAPGLKGANRTGRPFTGDYAGDLLYSTLLALGLAHGPYAARPDDGLTLQQCRITNAVRCVPPENKPTGVEAATCRRFLAAELTGLPRLTVVLALGGVAYRSVLAAMGVRQASSPFKHGAWVQAASGVTIGASYHCSRYNTNTGRLTPAMFESVLGEARSRIIGPDHRVLSTESSGVG